MNHNTILSILMLSLLPVLSQGRELALRTVGIEAGGRVMKMKVLQPKEADGEMEITQEELDNYLFLESGVVPFPAWTPYPSEDGLVFTYQQYEIAAYAAGMPEFTIPYADILPYLTPEAKALVGME